MIFLILEHFYTVGWETDGRVVEGTPKADPAHTRTFSWARLLTAKWMDVIDKDMEKENIGRVFEGLNKDMRRAFEGLINKDMRRVF